MCTSCAAPYSLYGDTCVACNSPCKTCTDDPDFCVTCIRPFSLEPDANGVCYRCAQDLCLDCLDTNDTLCF